jgi:hypothetical protein
MANDESFFREVNEDLRSDRVKAIWQRFGTYIVLLVVLLVLGTAATRGYQYWMETKSAKSGDQFLDALNLANEGKPDEALKALEAVEQAGHGAYPALARMRAASLQANKGDAKAAIDGFSTIGKDNAVPEVVRDVARIRAAYLLVDDGSYDDVAAQVQDLSGADNPMRHSAREALGLAAFKAGDMKKAEEWFKLITGDTSAPANLAQRAELMLDMIAARGTNPSS